MTNADDLLTMLWWVLGMITIIFIIDWFWLKPFQRHKQTERIIQRLREKNNSFYQTLPKFNGMGIVIVMSDPVVLSGSLLIITLRRILCKLPILVCYTRGNLNDRHIKFLESIQNVTTMALNVHGAQARAHALVYSPFQQVLLLEPHLLFFHNPEYLFNDVQYQQTGALFWKDRKTQSYWDKEVYDWVKKLIPYRKGDNRILNGEAGSYQSRDLCVFDKKRHIKTMEKLMALAGELDTFKESFWMAAELAKEEYSFVESYPGVIGNLWMDVLCGDTLYLDPKGNLLGWSGNDPSNSTSFTHYALFDDNAGWGGVLSKKCLKNVKSNKLSDALLGIINEYMRYLHDLQNSG